MSSTRHLLLVGIAFAITVGCLIVPTVNAIETAQLSTMWGLVLIVTAVTLYPLGCAIWRGTFDLFGLRTVFLVSLFLQFAAWPVMVYVLNFDSQYGLPITFFGSRYGAFIRGEIAAILGILAFQFTYAWTPENLRPAEPFSLSRSKLLLTVTLTGVVGVLAFLQIARIGGGLLYFLSHIDEFRVSLLLGAGYLLYLLDLAEVAGMALILANFLQGNFVLFSKLFFGLVLLISFAGAHRHTGLAMISAYIIVRHYSYKRIRLSIRTVTLLIAFLLLNVGYALFRSQGTDVFRVASNQSIADLTFGVVGRFHGAESIARVVDITSHDGFQYGSYLLSDLITSSIPRFLWPEKPLSSGLIANTTFFYELFKGGETGSAVITLIGELYWIAGLPVVVVGMALMGAWLKRRELAGTINFPTLGYYCIWFDFALAVNESLSLHLYRALIRTVMWTVMVAVIGQKKRAATDFDGSLEPIGTGTHLGKHQDFSYNDGR